MKNIANKTTGQIIVITKRLTSDEKVAWTLYQNGVLYKNSISYKEDLTNINKDVLSTSFMNYNDFLDWLAEETIIVNKPAFERVSKININWVFNKGITNQNTIVRIYVPHETIGTHAQTGDDIDLWLQSIGTQKVFRTKDKQGIVQYLETLSQQDETMLQAYISEGVIIDYK